MTSNNVFKWLRDPVEIVRYWDFFNEGRTALNDPDGAKATYSESGFLVMLMKAINLGPESGVLLVTSKNDKPLAFMVGIRSENFDEEVHFFVWAAYSNKKCKTVMSEIGDWTSQHCRRHNIPTIKAATRRINGCAFRLFERFWGFRREYLTFTKSA